MATRPAPPEPDLTGDTRVAKQPLKYIKFEIGNFIARLTLSHAPHNVLTVPMMKEMAEAIESLNGRGDVKAILLTSSQQAFFAGISLEDSRPDRVFQTLDAFTRVFQAMVDISKPVVVVVNGPAIGAGSELVGFGDVVIATPKAKFAASLPRHGMMWAISIFTRPTQPRPLAAITPSVGAAAIVRPVSAGVSVPMSSATAAADTPCTASRACSAISEA